MPHLAKYDFLVEPINDHVLFHTFSYFKVSVAALGFAWLGWVRLVGLGLLGRVAGSGGSIACIIQGKQ